MQIDGLAQRLTERLQRGRAAAEARMLSRGTLKRKSGGKTTNSDGFEVDAWTTIHADLRVQLAGSDQGASGARTVRSAGLEASVAVRTLKVPAGTAGIKDGDVLEITAGENAGCFLTVVEATGQDQATALRLPVFEVPEPEGWNA